jgi:hypothetical protein
MAEERRAPRKKTATAKGLAKASARGVGRAAQKSPKKTGPARPKATKVTAAPRGRATKGGAKKPSARRKATSGAHVRGSAAAPRPRPRRTKSPGPVSRSLAVPATSEEEIIESAKYAAPASRRVFEEERFIFPETYGVNRVRLLVKDPEWLFAHWDVDPDALAGLGGELGTRGLELSKLTLKVFDPANGGSSVILLPGGARSWYIRADGRRRAYRAELGVTLPSGEFRVLAESNTVMTPRVGPSPERAARVLSYRQGRGLPAGAGRAAAELELQSATGAGEWSPEPNRAAPSAPGEWLGSPGGPGGASDSFGLGGASDVHRR